MSREHTCALKQRQGRTVVPACSAWTQPVVVSKKLRIRPQGCHPGPPLSPETTPVLDLQQVADQRVGGQGLSEAPLSARKGRAAGAAVPRQQMVAQAGGKGSGKPAELS